MGRKMEWFLVYGLLGIVFMAIVFCGNRAVMTISESLPIQRKNCIVIDPGHGGEDGGAISVSGKLESAYNLEISLILNDLLNLLGYDTVMTRNSDISIYTTGDTLAGKKASDLKERVKIVTQTPNAILLSIHQNYFPDGRYSGAQVFYANSNNSKELAKVMQQKFVETLNPGSNRGIKQSTGIYLMEHIACTGVLIECGFLSNQAESAKLGQKQYQQDICCVIGAALSSFLSNT